MSVVCRLGMVVVVLLTIIVLGGCGVVGESKTISTSGEQSYYLRSPSGPLVWRVVSRFLPSKEMALGDGMSSETAVKDLYLAVSRGGDAGMEHAKNVAYLSLADSEFIKTCIDNGATRVAASGCVGELWKLKEIPTHLGEGGMLMAYVPPGRDVCVCAAFSQSVNDTDLKEVVRTLCSAVSIQM